MTFDEKTSEYYNGKSVLTFKIPKNTDKELYLVIFAKNSTNFNENLGNYIFKYMNSPTKDQFTTYEVENDNLEITTSKTKNDDKVDYHISFEAVPYSQSLNVKVSYIVKGFYIGDFIDNEATSTFAMTNSKGFTLQVDYPQIDDNNKVSVTVLDAPTDIKCLKVVAKIRDESINEYVAYNSAVPNFDGKFPKSYKAALIAVGVIALIIIAALVGVLIFFGKKNKDLLDKVNLVSFVEEGGDKKEGENLLFGNKEPLE